MTNWVMNQIEFEASLEDARQIYEAICIDGMFDFTAIEPLSFDAYCSALGLNEEINNVEEKKWYESSVEEWFLSRKSCDIFGLERFGKFASFAFETPWIVPYAVILAFGNQFKIPFTLKYFEESHDFWGIETYEIDEDDLIKNTSQRFKLLEDWRDLHLELMGCEPYEDDNIYQDSEREEVESA